MKRSRMERRAFLPATLAGLALLLWLAAPAGATLPSRTEIVSVNWPQMKAVAKRFLSPADVAALETVVLAEKAPASGEGSGVKPPFTPVATGFQRGFVDFLTGLVARGEARKVESFAREVSGKRLIRGHARWYRARGGGYAGPVDIVVALSISPEQEYMIDLGFRPPGGGKAKGTIRTLRFPTGVRKR